MGCSNEGALGSFNWPHEHTGQSETQEADKNNVSRPGGLALEETKLRGKLTLTRTGRSSILHLGQINGRDGCKLGKSCVATPQLLDQLS